jgi:hypothetical protein
VRRRWWDRELRWRRESIEFNTILSEERFLRPDGSEVSAVNSPVDGSIIPEEELSPLEDDPVLAGGAELSEFESLVLVVVVAESVAFVSVEEGSVELVSVEVSSEPVSVELSAGPVAVAESVELVVVELSEELVVLEDVELGLVQLLIDVALERSVSFRLEIRP